MTNKRIRNKKEKARQLAEALRSNKGDVVLSLEAMVSEDIHLYEFEKHGIDPDVRGMTGTVINMNKFTNPFGGPNDLCSEFIYNKKFDGGRELPQSYHVPTSWLIFPQNK